MPAGGRSPLLAVPLVAALLSLSCGVSATAPAPETAASAPGIEALRYLPAGAEAVAVIETDTRSARWHDARAALDATGLGRTGRRLEERLASAGLDLRGAESLGGNLLAIAAPDLDRPDRAVAALVVRDAERLDRIANARVAGGALRAAGTHREARLLAATGITVAIRDDLLLIAGSVEQLRAALDRRESGEGYAPETFKRALQDLPARVLARVAIDPRRRLARAPGAWRAVPWLDAVGAVGMSVGIDADAVTVHVRADTSEGELTQQDVPLPRGAAAGPVAQAPGLTASLVDLPHVLNAAYRAAFAAAPSTVARAELASLIVRGRRRLDPPRALLAELAGPATVVFDGRSVLLRARVKSERRANDAVGRLSARLPGVLAALGVDGVEMRPLAGLKAAVKGHDVLALFGVRDGLLLAGSGRPRALERLARTPERRAWTWAKGPLAFRASPGAARRLTGLDGVGELRGWLRAGPRVTRGEIRLALR